MYKRQIWDLGDGNSSSLKNPVHPFTKKGNYLISLIVKDQGGFYSEPITWNISVNDTTPPIPEISIDGVIIDGSLEVYTGQRIQFSAFGTLDNVPVGQMFFSWDWGDGSSESGTGLFEVGHSWADGSSEIFYLSGVRCPVSGVRVRNAPSFYWLIR